MPSYSVIAPDGRAYGPADAALLAQWAREGRLTAQTVLRDDSGVQRQAQTIPEIAPLLGLPPQMVQELMQPGLVGQAAVGNGNALQYAQPFGSAGAIVPNAHGLEAFSVPGAILLHYVTFGIFSWIHFGLMHDRLPQLRRDDPSAAKAICFMLIPFFNVFYWRFFECMRICDRVNEQRRMAGLPETAPRGLAIAYSIVMIIPYFNVMIGFPILGPIYYGMLRSSVNELVYVTRGRA